LTAVDNGDVDVIVSRHMDRLLRRLAELENVLARCEATGTIIVTAADGVDTSSDGGRLVARILSSVAQAEVERKAARQKSAVIQAAKQGRWVGGRRPFGYQSDGMTIIDNEAALIRQGYADILSGLSLSEVARRWTATGIPTPQGNTSWLRTSVKDVLTNSRYAGLRRHRTAENRANIRTDPLIGVVGPAQWPAVVDEQTWRAAVRVLCDPQRRGRTTGPRGLLTGIAVCAVCGLTVHRGAAVRGTPSYRCRSMKHFARTSEPIDRWVCEVAVARLSRPDVVAALHSASHGDTAALMTEVDVLRRRRDDIATDYADGEMTREQFRTANTRILERIAEVESALAAANPLNPMLTVAASEDVRAAWDSLTTNQQRVIIDSLMTIKLHPVGRGVRTFRPESIEITPKESK
jgi:site-specific DNA recombinase